jgi:predicted CXXCH cytochrome family protein
MAGRVRNQKSLSQRIEREYFKRRFGIPRWRWYLTFAIASVGVGWLSWGALRHDSTVFSSGPLTPHHASFGNNCRTCHVLQTAVGSTVTDQGCMVCHDGPLHKDQQTSAPACVECHVEHQGRERLLGAGSLACVRCHSDLKTKNGRVTVAAHIESIANGHPEFTPLRPGQSDPGGLKFNHKVHLRKDLKAPGGTVQLECNDCHRPTGVTPPWRYGSFGPALSVAPPIVLPARTHVSTRAYMQAINYYEHCSACHPLNVDKRIAAPAPHDKPEAVVAFLEPQFRKYIERHPEEFRASSFSARIPRAKSGPAPRTREEWVRARVVDAERLLWSKTCAECHKLASSPGLPVPKVVEARITTRWLQHGQFDHNAHRMADCASCHSAAKTSEKTSEVLVPGVKLCLACHDPETRSPLAGAGCTECHQYHDWSKEKPRHGSLALPIRN